MMFQTVSNRLRARSAAALSTLENDLDRIMKGWLTVALLSCSARVAAGPVSLAEAGAQSIFPYILLIVTPVVSMALALRWFANGQLQPQPTTRLAFAGQWRPVSPDEAQAHPLYGTSGIMLSLLIGILLNVPVRAAEFLTAMPPIPLNAPEWLSTLGLVMTLDVVLFTSLYSIAFVAALRRVPLFPRLLVAIWMCDIIMQIIIGNVVAASPHLPYAVASSLRDLLVGNVQKVLISVTLWLPYLMLSKRVNVTYRQRVPS